MNILLTLATVWKKAALPTCCLCLFIAISILLFSLSISLRFVHFHLDVTQLTRHYSIGRHSFIPFTIHLMLIVLTALLLPRCSVGQSSKCCFLFTAVRRAQLVQDARLGWDFLLIVHIDQLDARALSQDLLFNKIPITQK